MVACPRSSCTSLGCTPRPSNNVAHVCRRSWNRISGRLAFLSSGLKERFTSRISQETIVPVEPRASFYDHCYKTVYAQLDAKLADVFEAIDEVQQISGGGA
jgi:hypothetical protein